MPIRFRRALIVVALAALLALVGCKARATVAVHVQPDGSGAVTVTGTFDADAVAQIGDVAAAVKVDDLRSAGWDVVGPTSSGADTIITATKPFAAANRLGAVLEEIGGPDGPFADWKLTTSNSFTVSSYELSGRVKLSGSLDQFSDSEVAAALDGFAVGRSPDDIAAALKADPDALTLAVSVSLPGELDETTGLTRTDGGAAAADEFRLGTGSAVDRAVELKASSTDRSPVLWVIVGGGLIVASGLLFVAGRNQARRRARRRPTV